MAERPVIQEHMWEKLAELNRIPVKETKQKYEQMLATMNPMQSEITSKVFTPASAEAALAAGTGSLEIPFDIGILWFCGIRGAVTYTPGSGPWDWTVKFRIELLLLGNPVRTEEYTFGPTHTGNSFEVNIGLAKASIGYGIRSDRLCAYIKGGACYYNLVYGWQCAQFDETIFCFL